MKKDTKKKTKKVTKKNKDLNKKVIIVNFIISFVTILICIGGVILYNKKFLFNNPVKEIKEVVINKEITEGVDKVYNSVVTVENYIAGKIYSTGTGFVYSKDNEKIYIITNYHVIDSANETYIIFPNKEKFKTKLVGYDEYQDIAVLSIPLKEDIKPLELGNSSDIKLGDTTFIIGTPINQDAYAFTVTKGIISGKDRLVEYSFSSDYRTNETYFIKVLQTDAAINSGNSGGPLCDINGNVIGVINLKISSDNVESIGFAIPIEDVKICADKIISGEGIIKPYIPFIVQDIEENDKILVSVKSIKKEDEERYKIKEDDVIKKINDEEIKNSSYLKYVFYKYNVGDTITISYERNEIEDEKEVKKEYSTEITLENK